MDDPMNDYCPETWLGSDYIAPQPMTARDDLLEPFGYAVRRTKFADGLKTPDAPWSLDQNVTTVAMALQSECFEIKPLYGPEAKARIEALEAKCLILAEPITGFRDAIDRAETAEAQRDEAVKALERIDGGEGGYVSHRLIASRALASIKGKTNEQG